MLFMLPSICIFIKFFEKLTLCRKNCTSGPRVCQPNRTEACVQHCKARRCIIVVLYYLYARGCIEIESHKHNQRWDDIIIYKVNIFEHRLYTTAGIIYARRVNRCAETYPRACTNNVLFLNSKYSLVNVSNFNSTNLTGAPTLPPPSELLIMRFS